MRGVEVADHRVADTLLKMGEFPRWWWNPNNPDAHFDPPEEVATFLRGLDPDLRLSWNPIKKRHQLWHRPDVNNQITAERTYATWASGWRHLTDLEDADGKPLPVTVSSMETVCALVLAKTYGGADKKLEDDLKRSAEAEVRRNLDLADQRRQWAKDIHGHWKPSVGFGKSAGNKAATDRGLG